MRMIISETSSGKSYQAEIPKDKEALVVGKKIGEEVDGGVVGAAGYVLELTGGSDDSGFPMRREVYGQAKKNILTTKGTGFYTTEKGKRKRCYVRGNIYSSDIVQVNTKIKKAGQTSLDEIFKKEEKAEESK